MVATPRLGSESRPHIPFPVKLLAMATPIGLALLAGVGWYILSASEAITSVREREFHSLELLGAARIAHGNRTASARQAVGAAAPRWRERHYHAVAQWQSDVAELQLLAPAEFRAGPGKGLADLGARLLALDEQAFSLVSQGQTDAAAALLFGNAYEQEEQALREKENWWTEMLRLRLQLVLDTQRRRGKLAMTSFCLAFPTLVLVWIFSLRTTLRRLDQQRVADRRLQESEQRLSTLFEGIDDTLLVHDLEGRILDCIASACRRLGYTRDALLTLRTPDIDSPEFAVGFAQRCARQMAAGAYVCEGVHAAKDGTLIPVDLSTRVIAYRG